MWVYDETVGLNCRDVTFVPGLYKIFDEILGKPKALQYFKKYVMWLILLDFLLFTFVFLIVNAADNKQRDKYMSCIKVNIDV